MDSTLKPNDKRQYPRLDHSMLTEVIQEGGQAQEALAVDFSLSGVKLALTHPVATDQPLHLQLRLPAADIDTYQRQEPLNLQARIAWQREEDGCLRCGAEFIGLSSAQKERLTEGFALAKKLLAASIAGVLFPTAFASAQTAMPLSANILADQVAVKVASDRVQTNLSKVLQDVLNLQSNTAGSNNAGLNLLYQASLAINVAKLSAEGANLAKATGKLKADANPILSVSSAALQKASQQYASDVKLGRASAQAANEAALKKAAQQASLDQQVIYGTLVPTLSDKVQADIGTLAKNVVKLGADLLAKTSATDKAAAVTADKAKLASNFTSLLTSVVAMKPVTPDKPTTQDKPIITPEAVTAFVKSVGITQEAATSLVQSVGALMVKQPDGKSVSVTSLITSFLSGLIKSPLSAANANPVPTSTSTGPTAMKLLDGSEIAYMQSPDANPAEALGLFGVNTDIPQDKRVGYAMLTDKAGTTTAIGYGYPVQFSYAKALYGNDDLAQLSGQLGVSNLSGLAQGGGLFAYGMKLNNNNTRIAVSWSGTAAVINGTTASWNPAWANAKASNLGVGVTHKFNDQLTGGVNVGFLNESHGVLGSTYDPSSALSLGETNRTMSLGLSAGLNLSRDSSLLLEAGFATTRGGNASGMIKEITNIQSRSYGVSFMSKHLLKDDDRLSVSLVKPLRVVSGQVAVMMPSVDSEGTVNFNKEWVSLAPTGSETDYRMSYDMPLKKNQSLSIQANVRQDVQNVSGNNDASAGVSWSMKF